MTPDQKLFVGYLLGVLLLVAVLWFAAVMVRRADRRAREQRDLTRSVERARGNVR